MVGSLGLEAVVVGQWLRHQQFLLGQQCKEEEEILTRYESKDENLPPVQESQPNGTPKTSSHDSPLMGWEFKIVRASSDLFRNPGTFHRLCQEEAEAGWVLLEKLDDRRVRFKRPIAMREMVQSNLPRFDPYRCHYGQESNLLAWLTAIALMTAMLLPAFLGYALVSTTLMRARPNWPITPSPTAPVPSPAENSSTPETGSQRESNTPTPVNR